jgi:hypothetical protein
MKEKSVFWVEVVRMGAQLELGSSIRAFHLLRHRLKKILFAY